MKTGRCSVTLTRNIGISGDRPWRLLVQDGSSRLSIVEMHLSDAQFSRMMSGGYVSDVNAEFYAVGDKVGLTAVRETWTSGRLTPGDNKADVEAEATAHCPDGFEFLHGSWGNTGVYTAVFVKYVEPDTLTESGLSEENPLGDIL